MREWLRERFIVRAVISLPGDAFQRSQARVKTSLLLLEKRTDESQQQPPVFMYYCTAVGVDDSPRQRVLPIDELRRKQADQEIERVVDLYQDFRAGRKWARKWTVAGEAITDRMDVKAVLPTPGGRTTKWKRAGLDVTELRELIKPVYADRDRAGDVIDTADSSDMFTHLRVRYDGFAEAGDDVEASESKYRTLFVVRSGDLVFSHINAVHGAAAIVPQELDGLVVTNEYTVCRSISDIDIRVIWALVRSPVARADLLLLSTGIGRTRIDWQQAANLKLPLPPADEQHQIVSAVMKAEEAERAAKDLRTAAQQRVFDELFMDSSSARDVLAAFKPPK